MTRPPPLKQTAPVAVTFEIVKLRFGYRGRVVLLDKGGTEAMMAEVTGAKTPVFVWIQQQWQALHSYYNHGSPKPEWRQSFPWDGEECEKFWWWSEM